MNGKTIQVEDSSDIKTLTLGISFKQNFEYNCFIYNFDSRKNEKDDIFDFFSLTHLLQKFILHKKHKQKYQ